ncbi:pantetheine-phosphate adenylyltransferase [Parvicella tangerina]|uniref:Phosphopantetheine adenylyltransferase n=1 Tax=Parvicella tangerina TaxID=2829795 RepID=A0A916JRQ3_9FLAO|nr:pantetheine-phosphate adenylyltransferase [Parvicella tangerina]CAG5086267.1 Phosphopantetheine adenylyltransferase [Parvicella tangerina]
MSRIAVFAGSFDPITLGHFSIVEKALPLFDKIYVAVGTNTSKQYLFDADQRFDMAQKSFSTFQKVEIAAFEGLTVDFCKDVNANFLLRGLRNNIDFEYEKPIAEMNKKLYPDLETVFFITDAEMSCISSSIVRELIKNNGNVERFLPPGLKL